MADSRSREPDARTLDRLRSGDAAALAPVFELFGLRVHRTALRMMGNQADAEDVTQEIFLRVLEQANRFDGRSRFSTWLYRLAVRHCLNRIRQRGRRTAAEDEAGARRARRGLTRDASPIERLTAQDDLALVDRLLSGLSPHYRACVVLREIEGFSYAEIAELLELPIGTVMSRLSRARALLSSQLSEYRDQGAPRE